MNCFIDDPVMAKTQPLADEAEQEACAWPCFWLRGLVPSAWVDVPAPTASRTRFSVRGPLAKQPLGGVLCHGRQRGWTVKRPIHPVVWVVMGSDRVEPRKW
jgi:hypothetical protein